MELSRVKLKRLSNALGSKTVFQIILKIKHLVLKGTVECLSVLFIIENFGCLYSNLDTQLFREHKKLDGIIRSLCVYLML